MPKTGAERINLGTFDLGEPENSNTGNTNFEQV